MLRKIFYIKKKLTNVHLFLIKKCYNESCGIVNILFLEEKRHKFTNVWFAVDKRFLYDGLRTAVKLPLFC